jgi:hypothetical protein
VKDFGDQELVFRIACVRHKRPYSTKKGKGRIAFVRSGPRRMKRGSSRGPPFEIARRPFNGLTMHLLWQPSLQGMSG